MESVTRNPASEILKQTICNIEHGSNEKGVYFCALIESEWTPVPILVAIAWEYRNGNLEKDEMESLLDMAKQALIKAVSKDRCKEKYLESQIATYESLALSIIAQRVDEKPSTSAQGEALMQSLSKLEFAGKMNFVEYFRRRVGVGVYFVMGLLAGSGVAVGAVYPDKVKDTVGVVVERVEQIFD